MGTHDIIIESENDYKKLSLTTANTNYIASLEDNIVSIQIEFTGENLPSISAADITSDIPFTFESVSDTSSDQSFRLELSSAVAAVNLSFTFVGQNYVCHIYKDNVVSQIKPFSGGAFQNAPITETWHSNGMVSDRTYNVYFLSSTDIPTSGDILSPPDITESGATVSNTPDDYYNITLHPQTGGFGQTGEFDFKCNGVTFLHVIAVND